MNLFHTYPIFHPRKCRSPCVRLLSNCPSRHWLTWGLLHYSSATTSGILVIHGYTVHIETLKICSLEQYLATGTYLEALIIPSAPWCFQESCKKRKEWCLGLGAPLNVLHCGFSSQAIQNNRMPLKADTLLQRFHLAHLFCHFLIFSWMEFIWLLLSSCKILFDWKLSK